MPSGQTTREAMGCWQALIRVCIGPITSIQQCSNDVLLQEQTPCTLAPQRALCLQQVCGCRIHNEDYVWQAVGASSPGEMSERTPQQVARTVCFTSTASCHQLLMQSLIQTSSPSHTNCCKTYESYTERDVSVRSELNVMCCLDEHG